MYQVWCEYDIGLENVVFERRAFALETAMKAAASQGFEDFEFLENSGLLTIKELEVR